MGAVDRVTGEMNAEAADILIADDDVEFRDVLCDILEPEGFRTYTADDGEAALQFMQDQAVDLLLLDMHMPRLTGLQTLIRVKNQNRLLPCILLSAEADDALRRKAHLADAFEVLRKPVPADLLRSTVHSALATRL